MDVCFLCCVLSGTGLCEELIIRPENSYQLWCVVLTDLETWCMRGPWPIRCCDANKQTNIKLDWSCPIFYYLSLNTGACVGAVVEALRYKPEGRGIDSRRCHWKCSLT
jgi:hypothetical protein